MRKLVYIVAVICLLMAAITSTSFAAESTKTAIVDISLVLTESNAAKKANLELNSLLKSKQAALEEKAKIIEKLKQEYAGQANTMSPEEKKAKEEAYGIAVKDYQQSVAEADLAVNNEAVKLRTEVLQEVKEVLKKISQEDNYV